MMIDGHELVPGDFIEPSRALIISIRQLDDKVSRHVWFICGNVLHETIFHVKAKFEVIR